MATIGRSPSGLGNATITSAASVPAPGPNRLTNVPCTPHAGHTNPETWAMSSGSEAPSSRFCHRRSNVFASAHRIACAATQHGAGFGLEHRRRSRRPPPDRGLLRHRSHPSTVWRRRGGRRRRWSPPAPEWRGQAANAVAADARARAQAAEVASATIASRAAFRPRFVAIGPSTRLRADSSCVSSAGTRLGHGRNPRTAECRWAADRRRGLAFRGPTSLVRYDDDRGPWHL